MQVTTLHADRVLGRRRGHRRVKAGRTERKRKRGRKGERGEERGDMKMPYVTPGQTHRISIQLNDETLAVRGAFTQTDCHSLKFFKLPTQVMRPKLR
jgi:hypothetical protein